MKFTESLWLSIGNIYGRILEHPFVQGLTDGSLDEEAFRFYVIQDALYLRDYARGLALLGAKAPRVQWLMMFVEHARDTIAVERALHESFFKDWRLSDGDVYSTPMAPPSAAGFRRPSRKIQTKEVRGDEGDDSHYVEEVQGKQRGNRDRVRAAGGFDGSHDHRRRHVDGNQLSSTPWNT